MLTLPPEFLVKINAAVSTAVAAAASLEDDLPWFSEAIGREVEGSTNIHSYSMSGTLSHLVFRPELWVDRVRDRFTPATQAEALALIGTAYSVRSSNRGSWGDSYPSFSRSRSSPTHRRPSTLTPGER